MIYVSQGHEHSIGLEVFLKSFLTLSTSEKKQFCLFANKQSLKDTLDSIKVKYFFHDDFVEIQGMRLNVKYINNQNLPQSTESLSEILKILNPVSDILLTLPTSKDQLILNNKRTAGYTEYLRKKYDNDSISMLFSSPSDDALLITDHIKLADVSSTITSKLIVQKVSNVLMNFSKYFHTYEEIIFAGINPHAGEDGILGNEDKCISVAIEELQKKFNIPMVGPLSGDTLHFHRNTKKQLLVYMFHDQGLPWFKSKNHVVGLNISLGLPFLRMSVDHGTAFALYKKNKANYLGCHYLLKSAIKAQSRLG